MTPETDNEKIAALTVERDKLKVEVERLDNQIGREDLLREMLTQSNERKVLWRDIACKLAAEISVHGLPACRRVAAGCDQGITTVPNSGAHQDCKRAAERLVKVLMEFNGIKE